MIIWIDAQLPPTLAEWIVATFELLYLYQPENLQSLRSGNDIGETIWFRIVQN
jgi:predicted nuclease of predicted toxin-antitoxin system